MRCEPARSSFLGSPATSVIRGEPDPEVCKTCFFAAHRCYSFRSASERILNMQVGQKDRRVRHRQRSRSPEDQLLWTGRYRVYRENGYISQPSAIPTSTNIANDQAAYFTRSIGLRRPKVPKAREMTSANSSSDCR